LMVVSPHQDLPFPFLFSAQRSLPSPGFMFRFIQAQKRYLLYPSLRNFFPDLFFQPIYVDKPCDHDHSIVIFAYLRYFIAHKIFFSFIGNGIILWKKLCALSCNFHSFRGHKRGKERRYNRDDGEQNREKNQAKKGTSIRDCNINQHEREISDL